LSYELGDILWALARLVDDLGLDFSKIAERNIAKLEDRKKRNVISGSGDKR
jgi:NTP pyrophosphatase (non-canonical NTP hydrolase)